MASRMSSTIWKSRPSSSPKAAHGSPLVGREARDRDRARDRRAQQPAGLQLVQVDEPVGVEVTVGRHVHVLASDHPEGRGGELPSRLRALVAEHEAEGLGQERVPREDGDAFAEAHMGARLAAPKVVVVQRRQVVVDEAEGVDELERAGSGQHLGGRTRERLAGRQAENRPNPLPAAEERVAERLLELAELVGERQAGQLDVDELTELVG